MFGSFRLGTILGIPVGMNWTVLLVAWLIAFMIAGPLGYFAMERWLQNFAYRTDIRIEIFLVNAALLFLASLATVSFQAVKAALADPVISLRYE